MICVKCGEKKPETGFYKRAKSGRKDKTCKACRCEAARKHRQANIDKVRAYDRERGNRQSMDYVRGYRESNPAKYKAHCAVNNALRDGILSRKPCEVCGAEPANAHHDDYLRPLDVRWLCQAHHAQWHAVNGEALNASASVEEYMEAIGGKQIDRKAIAAPLSSKV